ncbi:unnamed protein product [Urochloa humidicola]
MVTGNRGARQRRAAASARRGVGSRGRTRSPLSSAGRDSMLGALVDSSWNVNSSGIGGGGGVVEYFIDCNPACFAVLLDMLRTVSLDHSQVNAAYLDAVTLLVGAQERLGKCDGGMDAFSAASDELRHRF